MKFHLFHKYEPILCQYYSFETRKIVYECKKCGHKKLIREHRNYYMGIPFTMETDSLVENHEVHKILNTPEILGRDGVLKIIKPWVNS